MSNDFGFRSQLLLTECDRRNLSLTIIVRCIDDTPKSNRMRLRRASFLLQWRCSCCLFIKFIPHLWGSVFALEYNIVVLIYCNFASLYDCKGKSADTFIAPLTRVTSGSLQQVIGMR